VPPWNLDPEDSISIQLNVSTSASRHRAIQEAAETAAATIQQASGQTLSIKLKLTSPKAVLPSTPIAVSFSSEDGQLTTPVFSSRPSAEESEELAQTLYQSIFGTVRSHLTKENPRQVKEASPETSDHFNILKNRVSRLSWLRMGESLHLKE